jgi:hypothetical protein
VSSRLMSARNYTVGNRISLNHTYSSHCECSVSPIELESVDRSRYIVTGQKPPVFSAPVEMVVDSVE